MLVSIIVMMFEQTCEDGKASDKDMGTQGLKVLEWLAQHTAAGMARQPRMILVIWPLRYRHDPR